MVKTRTALLTGALLWERLNTTQDEHTRHIMGDDGMVGLIHILYVNSMKVMLILNQEIWTVIIPVRGYRESGSMETVSPAWWKPTVRV